MKPSGSMNEILRLLSQMPFLDRLEMSAVSGWSRAAVYEAVRELEHDGLASPVPHATDLTPLTARYHLTADGVRMLAREEEVPVDDLLSSRPLSLQWRAVMLKRLDAAAAIYRLASAASYAAHLVGFQWYRAMPVDAAMLLPRGRTIAIVRQGPTSTRTAFSKRIRRLRAGPIPGGILILAPDEVRLRHARRLLPGAYCPILLALESDAAAAGPDDPVWRLPSSGRPVDLRTALEGVRPGPQLPDEQPLSRISLPWDMPMGGPNRDLPDHALPSILKSAEKRALDLLSDWPWIALKELASLLAVSDSRASRIVSALDDFGLVGNATIGRLSRLALTDRGLGVLAHRDRASLPIARSRWSAEPFDPNAPLDWRNVSGSGSRQLLRNADHTAAVHAFVAALVEQARTLGWGIAQIDPPRRASRYFRHEGTVRSIQPDAFGILRRGSTDWPFFLEWERRAVRPATMAARIAPYIRYYSTHRPADDHGTRPALLVVFHDDLAAARFLRTARDEMTREKVTVPLWISHGRLLKRVGPLGRAWRSTDGHGPTHAAPARP